MHRIFSKLKGFLSYYFECEGSNENHPADERYHNRYQPRKEEERIPSGDGKEDSSGDGHGSGRGDGIGCWEGDNLEMLTSKTFILEESNA